MDILAYAYSKRGRECWQWIIPRCPFCHKEHYHGGGDSSGDPRTLLGGRGPHCVRSGVRQSQDYILVDRMLSYEETCSQDVYIVSHGLNLYKHKTEWGGVYLLCAPDQMYKIGASRINVIRRVKDIVSSFPVVFVALVYSASPLALERQLHKCLAHKRVLGEWFRLEPQEVCRVKEAMQSAGHFITDLSEEDI